MKEVKYSVVVPVYNEEENVVGLFKEIRSVMDKLMDPYEVIFVNDGSTDKTLVKLKKLKPLKIISFRKNYGQSAALDAGIKASRGEFIITMDGDGQNDPADIPKMIKRLDGYDVVCGWRADRKDPFSKRFISSGARFLRRFLVSDGVHDSGCTLRVYRKECFEDLDLYGELHRMLPAMLRWKGFNLTEVKVNHRPRKHGTTKYSWERTIKGFLDMLGVWFWRKYESRPLHLFGTVGIFLSGLSVILMIWLAVARLYYGYSLSDKIWPLIAVTSFITGIQLFIFGILADLIIKSRSDKTFYNIKEVIEL